MLKLNASYSQKIPARESTPAQSPLAESDVMPASPIALVSFQLL